ncbi:chemotaxis protein CheD [Pelagibacterium montanilacus]|uniref:chemotaxis protein CheD n=1 Tax=Pelagibacterium montanilacus TaxID=2185280 RepID=UPI0019D233B3|nr:chemotaxis protein CheD [Pelagibacterium montanilacus]
MRGKPDHQRTLRGTVAAPPIDLASGTVRQVVQGECLVTADPELTYSTVLGSCVAACVRDVDARVGGVNHFLLAGPGRMRADGPASARYGDVAMAELIAMVLAQGTGRRAALEIKLFGGGSVHEALADIGAQNIACARQFLFREGFAIAGEDLGGAVARRILYHPASGRVFVRRLRADASDRLAHREIAEAGRVRADDGHGTGTMGTRGTR